MTSSPASAPTELTVSVERLPGSRAELRIEAPASEVDAAVQGALQRLARRVRLPGFRPGKAPGPVVERAVGWPAVRQEAVDHLLPSLYERAVAQAGVEPVGDPDVGSVGDVERGRPLRFTATVTLRPEVELRGYDEIRVARRPVEITEERLDEVVEEVRRRHSELVAVDRPAREGDVLLATLTMRRGEELIGGEGGERDVELEREHLVEGLFDGLVGATAGEAREMEVVLPDSYPEEELRGVSVSVSAQIAAVRERRLPPADDSLAALDGHGSTLEALREHYRGLLLERGEREEQERFEAEVLDRVRDCAVVDVPEAMVEQEIERQLRETELRLARIGLRFDSWMQYTGRTMEQVRGEQREPAVQRVKLELALEALARDEGLEVDEADVDREVERLATGRKLTADQRRRLRLVAQRDLLLRGAGQRALEIAAGEG